MTVTSCKRSIISLLVLTRAIFFACALNQGVVNDGSRRKFVGILIPAVTSACTPIHLQAEEIICQDVKHSFHGIHDPELRNYRNLSVPKWHGTALAGPLSLSETCSQQLLDNSNYQVLTMGKWPDPILRHSASRVPTSVFQNEIQRTQLQLIATALKNTARKEGAVGLAAQQCGVDASLIYIDNVGGGGERIKNSPSSGEGKYSNRVFHQLVRRNNHREKGLILVNPRIVHRSPESDMLVWTEQCLVLPPEFRATLLRDAEITVEYESMDGLTKQIKLSGELARCVQHEMDHDRGVLIVDHVSLDELLIIDGNTLMADIENSDGLHSLRMQRAYSREVSESSLPTSLSEIL